MAINPTIVLPQSASESMFNTLDDHCYTPEPTFKLTGPPKFLNKKSSVQEESKKMVGKMKSAENAMKSSLGLAVKKMFHIKTGACIQVLTFLQSLRCRNLRSKMNMRNP